MGSAAEKAFAAAAEYVIPGLLEPEVGVGSYRIDFANRAARFGVEVDGLAFHNGQESFIADRKRQRAIEAAGWHVIRFAAKEVLDDAVACVIEARKALQARATLIGVDVNTFCRVCDYDMFQTQELLNRHPGLGALDLRAARAALRELREAGVEPWIPNTNLLSRVRGER